MPLPSERTSPEHQEAIEISQEAQTLDFVAEPGKHEVGERSQTTGHTPRRLSAQTSRAGEPRGRKQLSGSRAGAGGATPAGSRSQAGTSAVLMVASRGKCTVTEPSFKMVRFRLCGFYSYKDLRSLVVPQSAGQREGHGHPGVSRPQVQAWPCPRVTVSPRGKGHHLPSLLSPVQGGRPHRSFFTAPSLAHARTPEPPGT